MNSVPASTSAAIIALPIDRADSRFSSARVEIPSKPRTLRTAIETNPIDPGDSAEDDGWLMTCVVDLTTDTTELLVLHAQDLAAGPVATVHIPHRAPLGFHGNWIPDSELHQANG
jgi:hypothetical protein